MKITEKKDLKHLRAMSEKNIERILILKLLLIFVEGYNQL